MRAIPTQSSMPRRRIVSFLVGVVLFASGTIGEMAAEARPVTFLTNKAVAKKAAKKVVKKVGKKVVKKKPTRRPATRPTVPSTVAQPAPVTPPSTAAPTTAAPTTLPPIPPVFDLRADTPTATVALRQTAVFGVSVLRPTFFAGPVSFTASGVPAGSTAVFAPNPTSSSTVLYLTPASTADGTYPITITATAGVTTRSTSVTFLVQTQPNFALTVPASITAPAGSTTNTPIGFQSLTAAVPTVSLAISGLPGGVSANFVPNPTFGPSTLVLTVNANVSPGTFPVTITATAGAVTKTYSMSLQINGAGTYGLSAVPAALSIARGGSASSVVSIVTNGGFASPITFVASGIPSPATYGLAAGASSVTFTLAVPLGTPVGVYPATITGTSGSLTASVVISVTVT